MIAKTAKIKSMTCLWTKSIRPSTLMLYWFSHLNILVNPAQSLCSIPPPQTAKLACVKCEVVDFRGGRSRT
jgi:hypothetical protein